MALPESVQRAADQAEQLEQMITSGQNQPEEQPVEHSDNSQESQESHENNEDALRQRYASLQGKYNAEVPRLHSEKRDLEYRLQQMLEENSALRDEIAAREANTAYLTEEDSQTYGPEMLDFVQRVAKQEAAKYAQDAAMLKSEVNRLNQMVEASANNTQELRIQAFYDELTQLLPDWETQNSDPAFNDWLTQADPLTGAVRKEILTVAFEALDANRVAAMFMQFRQGVAGNAGTNPLAKQVTPARTRRGVEPTPSRHWTQKSIAAFYDKWMRKQIPDEEAVKIEREIQDAVATGKVVE